MQSGLAYCAVPWHQAQYARLPLCPCTPVALAPPSLSATACCAAQRLGRADSFREMVRKGASTALVELVISNGPGARDYLIQRELHAEDNRSTFKINGVHTALHRLALWQQQQHAMCVV
jgi:hypothetical protein